MKKCIYIFLFLLAIGNCNLLHSQNLDSLKGALKVAKHDTLKLLILDKLTEFSPEGEWQMYNDEINVLVEKNLKLKPSKELEKRLLRYKASYLNNKGTALHQIGNIKEAINTYSECITLMQSLGDKDGLANAYNNFSVLLHATGDFQKALYYQNKSHDLFVETKNKKGIANSLVNTGWVYENQGDVMKALDYYIEALRIQEQLNERKSMAVSYNNIGLLYFKQGIRPRAKEYLNKSLALEKEFHNLSGVAATILNIGFIHKEEKDGELALKEFREALTIYKKMDEKVGVANCLVSIGGIFTDRKNYDSALYYFNESLKLRQEAEDVIGIGQTLRNLGNLYLEKNEIQKAKEYGEKALKMARETNYPNNIYEASEILYKTYKKMGKQGAALEMYELCIAMRDTINSEKTRKQSLRKQFEYDWNKRALTDSLKKVEEKKIVDLRFKQEQTTRYALYGGLTLIIIFSGFLFKRFKVEQGQKKEIENQKRLVDQKQKEILDSITYAKRIQESLMPTEKYIERNVNELKKKK